MPLREQLSPQFQSLQGFHCMVPTGHINNQLTELFLRARAKRKGFDLRDDKGEKTHNSVRILDTFLSFPLPLLTEMLQTCDEDDFDVKILLLSPYSQLARTRAKAIARGGSVTHMGDSLLAANGALSELARALAEAQKVSYTPPPLEPEKDQRDTFNDILSEIRELSNKTRLELRFYDRVTDAPVYLISEFVAKGLLLDASGSERNPWLVFVDDRSQDGDIYDRMSKNFDSMWGRAISNPKPYLMERSHYRSEKRLAFIAMSMEEGNEELEEIKEAVQRVCVQHDYEARRADDVEKETRITDIIIDSIDRSDFVVCDLTHERPNVYYEAGFAHALGKPVLFIAKDGSEPHFDVKDYKVTYFEDVEDLKEKLAQRVERLVQSGSLDP